MKKASFSLGLIIASNVLIIFVCLSAGLHVIPQPSLLKAWLQVGDNSKETVWTLDNEVKQAK